MLSALEPEAQREMGNLLHQQARERQRFDSMIQTASPDDLDRISSVRVARAWQTRGGRHRRVPLAEPS